METNERQALSINEKVWDICINIMSFGVNSNTQLVIEDPETGDGLLRLLMLEHL